MTKIAGPLDRYVFMEWTKIFVATALGLPLLLIIIDLTDHLQGYLDRNVPYANIALSYAYWLPDSMFMAMPAAVLFATVFAVGSFTRYSEITAAKASGVSFYRIIAPIFLGATIAAGLDLVVSETSPITNMRRNDLLGENPLTATQQRSNFAYAGEYGRVYKATSLDVKSGTLDHLQIERKGNGPDYPTLLLSSNHATYSEKGQRWLLDQGELHIIRDSTPNMTVSFSQMRDKKLNALRPVDLMAKPRDPNEMRYGELSKFIVSLERSGGDASLLRVSRALKIAIPVTCIVIALIGAPLATSTQRGGSAYGIGISLAITVSFLMLVNLTKAIGQKDVFPPDYAAWLPNAVFALLGIVLLSRVKT